MSRFSSCSFIVAPFTHDISRRSLLLGLLSVLFVLDYLFISSAYSHTVVRGASAQIVFGFEV